MNQAMDTASTQESISIRELNGIEKLHWLMDQNHHNHFPMAAEVLGKTTAGMWRRALDKLQRRHPFLNVCIRLENGNNPVYHHVAGAEIPLTVKKLTSASQWEVEFEREMTTSFDAATAPLIRALLLQGDGCCQLILTAHHTIADGMSMVFLMRDLLCAISGKKLPSLPTPPSQDELLAPLLKTLTPAPPTRETNATPVNRPATFMPKDAARPKVRGVRLSQEATSLLVSCARQEQTTVHAALCAAFALAGREKSNEWKARGVRILCPIAIRKLLGIDDECVLALTAGNIRLDPPPGISVWELARQAKQALLPFQTLEGIASMFGSIGNLLSAGSEIFFEAIARDMGYELVVTNVGQAPFESEFRGLTLKALWGPSALNGLEGEQAIAASTVNGSLCLAHTSYTPFDSFLETAIDLLMSVCRPR
jgi:hypothetical protein